MSPVFRKVLIANRGEIACRIARSVRALGLSSVAVYSEADRNAPHVRAADEAVLIGPAPSAQSYLDIERILAAAQAVGADAVHPGYGFLSERAVFAERCAQAGLVFIGPSPEAIARMGSKIESKRLAAEIGVPVIPGFSLADVPEAELHTRATELGFPLLVKASAGGGGRGMRIVRSASELDEALSSAAREASAAFGDGTLLLERYLEGPRHIEIQIFGDSHGNVVHIFERECSIQRRHQKVIEESPSPAVDAALRARMGQAAVALGRALHYVGAGTVEMVLDARGEFYFLEVNTRLQVEHPVTEAVSGLDLVRMQLEVAQGLPLRITQAQLQPQGHAIEARLYAEDPSSDFLPATGRIALYREPSLPGLRIDSGVEAGSEVSVHYDPMLAKVIAHGADREQARARLVHGLRRFGIAGLPTNRAFLVEVLEHDAFARGQTTTHFIDAHFPASARAERSLASDPKLHAYFVAAALHLHAQRRLRPRPVPRSIVSGFRNNRATLQEERFVLAGESLAVRYMEHALLGYEIEVEAPLGSAPVRMQAVCIEATAEQITVEVAGVRRSYPIARQGQTLCVHAGEVVLTLERVPRFPPRKAAQLAGGCVAPMTGVVRQVAVSVGDRVEPGALLLMLEAMKMEHRLVAQAAGVVSAVRVKEGQMVDPDDVLVIVEAEAAASAAKESV